MRVVQPLFARKSPRVLIYATSVWRGSCISIHFSILYWVEMLRCIALAISHRGWSNVTTGIWPRFKCCIALDATSIACLVIAGDIDESPYIGKRPETSGCWTEPPLHALSTAHELEAESFDSCTECSHSSSVLHTSRYSFSGGWVTNGEAEA